MQNCIHEAILLRGKKYNRCYRVGSQTFQEWILEGTCPQCGSTLDFNAIKKAMEGMYAPEVAKLAFTAVEHLSDYFKVVTQLSLKGVNIYIPYGGDGN